MLNSRVWTAVICSYNTTLNLLHLYIDLFFDPSRNALSSGNSPISPFPRSGKFLAVSHLYLTKFRQKARVLHSSTESKMQENSRRQTIQSL